MGLHWEDVDFDHSVIHVRHATQSLWKKGIIITEPKTEKARRTIALPEKAVEALRKHKQEQAQRSHAGRAVDLVFTTSNGTPIGARNLIRDFQSALKKADLPRIRFHDLRHTSATLLLVAGVHPKVVQERLGHTRVDMTLDVYSHVIPDMQQEAAEKMNDLIK